MKKYMIMLMVAAFIVSTVFMGVGCKEEAAGEVEEATEEVTEEAVEETVSEEASTTETKDKVELNYLTYKSSNEFPDEYVKAFEEKYPYITVNTSHDTVDPVAYIQSQKTRLIAGDIDVTTVRDENIKEYDDAGYLMDLSDQPYIKNFMEGSLNTATIDGKIIGIPTELARVGVWYNKDIFDKYNLSEPETWDEFISICQTLESNGIAPTVNAGNQQWALEFAAYPFIDSIFKNDPDIFNKIKDGSAKYTDPEWVKAFKGIIEFWENGYIFGDILSVGPETVFKYLETEEAAMVIQGDFCDPWAAATWPEGAPFNLKVFAMPVPDSTSVEVPFAFATIECGITSTKHKDEVLLFLEWMASPEAAQLRTNMNGSVFPIKGNSNTVSEYLPLFDVLNEYPNHNYWYSLQTPAANTELLKGLQEIFAGSSLSAESLAERLQAAEESANS